MRTRRNPINEKDCSLEDECTDEELDLKGEENLIEKNKRINKPSEGSGGVVKNKPVGKERNVELIRTVEEEREETSRQRRQECWVVRERKGGEDRLDGGGGAQGSG